MFSPFFFPGYMARFLKENVYKVHKKNLCMFLFHFFLLFALIGFINEGGYKFYVYYTICI